MIIKNAIRCNICGDEIESTHRHDFVTCKCGACSVDGGHDYLRRCFKEEGCYTDISIVSVKSVCDLDQQALPGGSHSGKLIEKMLRL